MLNPYRCIILPQELSNYNRVLKNNLTSIDIPDNLLLCTNCNCTNDFHKHAIDSVLSFYYLLMYGSECRVCSDSQTPYQGGERVERPS